MNSKTDPIVQIGDQVLRQIAQEIPIKEISSSKIQNLLEQMRSTLDSEPDGVALAAPQIGESYRIFVIAPKAYEIEKKNIGKLIFINPKIIKSASNSVVLEEGCLSVRGKFGKIRRAQKLTLEAYDENGEKFTQGCTGLLAQIAQHEIDHLNGILFVDNAKDVEDILEESQEQYGY